MRKRQKVFMTILILIAVISITAIVFGASEIFFKESVPRGTFVIKNMTTEVDAHGYIY